VTRVRSFLSDRFGWTDYLKPFMEKPLPDNLNWTVTLGSLLALLFVIQAATGIFLAMYYNPSPDHAYQSIEFIMDNVELGGILRGIHHWGAGAMVIIVVVHTMVGFFYGAFKPPREITWITGVCLLLLILGFGFTGYLLPWDQKAYWATVVGTNIPRDIPIIGKWITRVLLGGDAVSGLTLTRFYAIHTLLLPAFTALCIVAHIYMVRIHGISEHRELSASDPEPSPELPKDTDYHFFPEHLSRASVVFAVVFGVILLLSVFARIPKEDIAGTIDPAYLPRPEWYYMWLFQFLTFFSGSTEIIGSLVVPAGCVLLLFLLPFISRSPERMPANRPVATAFGVAALVGVVYLSVMGMANSRPYGQIIRIPDRTLTRTEARGLGIFVNRECAYCHNIMGAGGRREGPDLSNEIAKERSKDWLVKFIKNPQAVSPWSIMPKYDFSRDELDALADFVLALDFKKYPVKTVTREQVIQKIIK